MFPISGSRLRILSNTLNALSGSRIRNPNPSFVQLLPPIKTHLFTSTALVHARQRPLLPSDAVRRVRRPLGHSRSRSRPPRDACYPAAQSIYHPCVRNWLLPRTNQAFVNGTVLRIRRLRLVSETFAQSHLFLQCLYFMLRYPAPNQPLADSDGRPPDVGAAASRANVRHFRIHPVRLAVADLRPLLQHSEELSFTSSTGRNFLPAAFPTLM
ncbi:hypothetical protein CORC01_04381 [Colletotrichum orchidophilum]|uniref:Uncharacterized protein n=1 Tax=Colletotrichum orchidophilum TaxID=1209926 RepID=A0A1G4BFX4_9PEZI|nr:uncharacterized protein CORC01_04381 [Colletotrichum orchidophilum]OHF00400.1 hypothetical protein CORC01_04381 [Colletotrichum orchidophilum]